MIFSKAEGPNLVRIFLSNNFNVYNLTSDGTLSDRARSNAINIGKELTSRNITKTSTIQHVRVALINYIDSVIQNYQVDPKEFKIMIDAVIESIIDVFDEIIAPFIHENK